MCFEKIHPFPAGQREKRIRRVSQTSNLDSIMIQTENFKLDNAVEIPVTIPFAPLSDHQSKMSIASINLERLGNRAIVIKNFLSAEECQEIVNFIECHCRDSISSEDIVMTQAHSKQEYRNNLRMIATSSRISQIFFERLAFALHEIGEDIVSCHERNSHQFLHNGFGMNGTWRLNSLNPCFRLCKYNPSGHFGPHYDGDYIIDPIDHRSLKTFMIYLNHSSACEEEGGFVGGETNFSSSHDMYFDSERQIYCSPPESIFASLAAERGDCLVFDHHILHEGAQVKSGKKYIMRSDVMYLKSPHEVSEEMTEEMIQKERRKEEAIRIFYEGMELEESGDVDGGIAKYRRAYKMCPELEECMI
jgi:hypothetical protein